MRRLIHVDVLATGENRKENKFVGPKRFLNTSGQLKIAIVFGTILSP